jgi:hypothetical protein
MNPYRELMKLLLSFREREELVKILLEAGDAAYKEMDRRLEIQNEGDYPPDPKWVQAAVEDFKIKSRLAETALAAQRRATDDYEGVYSHHMERFADFLGGGA